jgi:hypothetical protein
MFPTQKDDTMETKTLKTSEIKEAPKTLVGTAKNKNIVVRWSVPNDLHGLVYPSGHFVIFALKRERDEVLKNHKEMKPIAVVKAEREEAYQLNMVHRKQEIIPVVAANVRKVLGGKNWGTR